jgi:hypothetical protein
MKHVRKHLAVKCILLREMLKAPLSGEPGRSVKAAGF